MREEIRRGGKISGSGRRLGVNPGVPESGGQVVPENWASGEVSGPFWMVKMWIDVRIFAQGVDPGV